MVQSDPILPRLVTVTRLPNRVATIVIDPLSSINYKTRSGSRGDHEYFRVDLAQQLVQRSLPKH
jgi:hypothetical protein